MIERPLPIPPDVLALCRKLREHGHRTWVVGGCLRDMLLGRANDDWDLATSARPEQVQQVFRKVIPTGIQHGTVTVRFRGQSYELTTLRGEGAYSDGRRPDRVHFVDDIEADLARRDFTINAIAYDPFEAVLTDPFGGVRDLEARVLRAVRDPAERFAEDGLRVLRAARFVATLEVTLDPATEAAIAPTLETFRRVSAERVRDEWMKALRARAPSRAFAVMRRTGIAGVTLGSLAARYDDDSWALACAAVDTDAPGWGPLQRLAGLFLPASADIEGVERWLRDYRFSNAERATVVRLLSACAAALDDAPNDAELRRFASAFGREHVHACLDFRAWAAVWLHGQDSEPATLRRKLCVHARRTLTERVGLAVRELAVSGKQLIDTVGVPRGPEVGRLLEALLQEVLEDPARNEEAWLLARARQLEHRRGDDSR